MAFYWNRFSTVSELDELEGNFFSPPFVMLILRLLSSFKRLSSFFHAQLTSELFISPSISTSNRSQLSSKNFVSFDFLLGYIFEFSHRSFKLKGGDNCEHLEAHRFWYFFTWTTQDETISRFPASHTHFLGDFYELHFFYVCEKRFKLNLISIWMMVMSTSDIECDDGKRQD